MLNRVPTDKSALIAEMNAKMDEMLHLATKPKRLPSEMAKIPKLEDDIFDLKVKIGKIGIRERLADPAYQAKLAAMPKPDMKEINAMPDWD